MVKKEIEKKPEKLKTFVNKVINGEYSSASVYSMFISE